MPTRSPLAPPARSGDILSEALPTELEGLFGREHAASVGSKGAPAIRHPPAVTRGRDVLPLNFSHDSDGEPHHSYNRQHRRNPAAQVGLLATWSLPFSWPLAVPVKRGEGRRRSA